MAKRFKYLVEYRDETECLPEIIKVGPKEERYHCPGDIFPTLAAAKAYKLDRINRHLAWLRFHKRELSKLRVLQVPFMDAESEEED